MEFKKLDSKETKFLYKKLKQNFIKDEYRSYSDLKRTLNNSKYYVYKIYDKNKNIGFVGLWNLNNFIFIEHLAIFKKFRDKGYGTKTIELIKQANKPIVCEIEPAIKHNQFRRERFYKKLGFVINDVDYIQPSYRKNGNAIKLNLISYPFTLTNTEDIVKEIYNYIYNILDRSENVTIEPLTLNHNLNQVAKLIYYTDKYIFPYMFNKNLNNAKKILVNMITSNTIYNYKNITVAVLNNHIVGMCVLVSSPITIDKTEMVKAYTSAGFSSGKRFERVYNEYYNPINNEPKGVYVANVCVDDNFRGLGIASKLIKTVINNNTQYNLEVVKANIPALKLYKKAGFKIKEEYPGFTGVPCYRMTKLPIE